MERVGFEVGGGEKIDIVGAAVLNEVVGLAAFGDREGESVCMHTPIMALNIAPEAHHSTATTLPF
jgi:hypothetical protein